MFFESSGPLRGFKRCLTEGGIRTPFAVSWPGTIAPGVSHYPVAFWDWLPTVADLAGLAPSAWPQGLDGVSFKAEMLGLPQQPHPPLYWEFCTDALPPGVKRTGKGWRQAVRNGTFKGVSFFAADATMALYDLSVDPAEEKDVAGKHPEMVAAFMAFAKSAHVESPVFPSGDKACKSS
jgi:arylsulfatase A-like enzyme